MTTVLALSGNDSGEVMIIKDIGEDTIATLCGIIFTQTEAATGVFKRRNQRCGIRAGRGLAGNGFLPGTGDSDRFPGMNGFVTSQRECVYVVGGLSKMSISTNKDKNSYFWNHVSLSPLLPPKKAHT